MNDPKDCTNSRVLMSPEQILAMTDSMKQAQHSRIVHKNENCGIDTNMSTIKDTKPAATSSVGVITSTPGAHPVDASSSTKGQQAAFQKTKGLTDGPSYFPEDPPPQKLPWSLELESASSKRAAKESHVEKSEEKLKQSPDTVAIADEKLKRGAARKTRIASRTSEDTKQEEAEQYQDDVDVSPGAAQVLGMKSMNSTTGKQEEAEQHQDGGDASPGAVQMLGMNSMNSTGGGDESTRMIIEAQLVVEEDTERLAQYEREQIQEETRQKVLGEMGEVAQAEVVLEDDGSKTRRRALYCTGAMVILLGIILGSVFGTRETSSSSNTISVSATTTAPTLSSVPSETPSLRPSPAPSLKPSPTPTVAPLNNSLCQEAHPIIMGGDAIVASLVNATEQFTVFCEATNPYVDSLPGLWYKYIGQDKPVIAQASGVDLHVYPTCATTCDITDVIYGGSNLLFSTVAWTAVSGVEYLLLASYPEYTPGATLGEFQLQIVDNDSCDNAFGPITPGAGTFLLGSTSDGATIDTDVPSCGSASSATAPGVWYTIIGDGGAITASTCTGTGFDSQISVFTGSCGQLTCVDGNNNACGTQSLVAIQSNQDQPYHVLVHGFGGASGNFALQITTEAPALTVGDFCATSVMLKLGVTELVSLELATEDADVPRCFNYPYDGPSIGLWYKIVGTGNTMSIQLDSTVTTDLCGTFISVLTGTGCSNLSCLLQDCTDTGICDWFASTEQVYYIFISYIDSSGAPEGTLLLTAS